MSETKIHFSDGSTVLAKLVKVAIHNPVSLPDLINTVKNRKIECTIEIDLTPEGRDIVLDLINEFPNKCPKCGFTHDSRIFVKVCASWICDNCGYQLQEIDRFPSIIE